MTALSFVWVHPYSQISRCDTSTIIIFLRCFRCLVIWYIKIMFFIIMLRICTIILYLSVNGILGLCYFNFPYILGL